MPKLRLIPAVLLATSFAAPALAADEGAWLVRARALRMDTANESDPIPSLGVPSDAIHVSNKTFPELDITYFFARNWAAELVLTYPQKHDVRVTQSVLGSAGIGSFKHLPPTLSVQYHFLPEGDIRPYVGLGLNYTRIMSVHLEVPTVGGLKLENDSVGVAYGAGFDWKVAKNTFVNFDVKKVAIESDVLLGSTKVSRVKVDPTLVSVGVGWRF